MHWDDLRVVRAVYKTGSYAAAARSLGINETTVPRRLARLERDLGLTLFDAVDGSRRPSAVCERIVALSEPIASQTAKIESIAGDASIPVERRRITATDSVATHLIAPRLAQFLERNPGLSIELLPSTANVDFSRWEADIAIRLKRPEKGDFVVSKLADFELFYVAPAAGTGANGLVCAYPEDLSATPESKYLAETARSHRARLFCKNLLVNERLIRSLSCAGVLPGYMCRDLIDDDRYRCEKLPQTRSAWLLIQRHLRAESTTRRLVEWLRECAAELAAP